MLLYGVIFLEYVSIVEPGYVATVEPVMFYGEKPGWRHNQYCGLVH